MMSFTGRVIRGEGIAKTTGYPTLNLDRKSILGRIPRRGVWAAWAIVHGKRRAATLIIGVPYQLLKRRSTKIEVHFLRRATVRIGVRISVEPVAFLRPLRRFATTVALIKSIRADRRIARIILREY